MKSLLFFLLCLALCYMAVWCPPHLAARDTTQNSTALAIGDTIVTYGDNNRYIARLYAFVDEQADSVVPLIATVAAAVSARNDVQIILFVRAHSEASAKQFGSRLGWTFSLVPDIAGAYARLYKIQRYPVCVLTDGSGRVQLAGIPGAPSFQSDIVQAVQSIRAQAEHAGANGGLERVQQYIVRYRDGTPIDNWSTYFAMYLPRTQTFMIWDLFRRNLLLTDTQGVIQRDIALTKIPENHGSTVPRPILFGGHETPGEVPFLNLNFLDMTSTMYTIHTRDGTPERLWDAPPTDERHRQTVVAMRLTDTTFLTGHLYYSRQGLVEQPEMYTARIIGPRGNVLGTLGRYEAYNTSHYVINYISQAYCTDADGNICMMESFSDTIRVYTPSGTLVRSIPCLYDSTLWNYRWREYFAPLDEESPIEEIMTMADKITKIAFTGGLLYDAGARQIYVVYQHKYTTAGDNTSYRYFLHRPHAGGKTVRRDLALPGDAKPVCIRDGLLLCTETVDGVLTLTSYHLPDWL